MASTTLDGKAKELVTKSYPQVQEESGDAVKLSHAVFPKVEVSKLQGARDLYEFGD